jgi:hypothetical protein
VPSPRTCRECATPLPTNVRWCSMCGAGVRDFAPREFQASPYVAPIDARAYSRWQKGATTFGSAGRLGVTAMMVVLGVGVTAMLFRIAWPFALWFLSGWAMLGGVVLRHTWQAEPVPAGTSEGIPILHRTRVRIAAHSPLLGRRIPGSVASTILAVVSAVALAILWSSSHGLPRFFLAAGLLAIGLGLFLARFNGL